MSSRAGGARREKEAGECSITRMRARPHRGPSQAPRSLLALVLCATAIAAAGAPKYMAWLDEALAPEGAGGGA